jgi:hypothetical protein
MRPQTVFAIGYHVDDLTRVMTARLYWLDKARGNPLAANGLLEGKPVPKITTRKDIVTFLNGLAHKVGIERTVLNPKGYLATEENIG